MLTNKLMIAAAKLYNKAEREEILYLFACMNDGFDHAHYPESKSKKIWRWGIERWGRDFAIAQYELGDLNRC